MSRQRPCPMMISPDGKFGGMSNQERCWANWGAKGSLPLIGLDRNRVRQIHMADRATTPASPLRRPSPCIRSSSDPGGLLPRRHLRRLSGVFPHVADREPLGLDLLLHFLLSHLEYIRFRPTRQFSHGELHPRYLTPQAWPQLARLAAPSALLQRLPCQRIRLASNAAGFHVWVDGGFATSRI